MRRHTITTAPILALFLSAAALAQPGWLTQPQTPEQMLANRIAAMGLITLEGASDPTEGQVLMTRTLFDMALEVDADDAEMWRLRAELARLDEDAPRMITALRQYAKLRPEDDAVQWSLILDRVAEVQTADGRLALVERLLTAESAQGLSEPLRSRLAAYAASAAQEIGDNAKHLHWLKEALRLDETNVAAAQMTYNYTLDHTTAPLPRGAALVHLIRAAPGDPLARMLMAQFFAEQRAYTQAAEQLEMTAQLSSSPLAPDQWQLYVISLAASGRHEDALGLIDRTVQGFEYYTTMAQQQNIDPPPVATMPNVELMRLGILHQLGRSEAADASFARLKRYIERAGEKSTVDLPLIAAAFNREVNLAEAALGDASVDESERSRIEAWLAFHRGEVDRAVELWGARNEADPLAQLGLALAEKDEAARREKLRSAVASSPLHPAGMMAAVLLNAGGATVEASDAGRAVVSLMGRYPQRLWHCNLQTTPWVTLKLEVIPPRSGYLEPVVLRATMRNVSGVPLAVGPKSPANSRLWVIIEPSVQGRSMGPQPPLVVDLGRTLRLNAGEALVHTMRPDRSRFGFICANAPSTPFNWRVTGVLDPVTNEAGVIEPSAAGARAIVGSLLTTGLPVTAENVELWLADLGSEDAVTQQRAVGRLLNAMNAPPGDADATRQRIADALTSHYESRDRRGRVWMLSMLTLAGDHKALMQRVIDDAERSDDPMTRLVYLIACVHDPDDNAVLSAMRHNDPQISKFAEALRPMLEEVKRMREEAEAAAEAARLAAEEAAAAEKAANVEPDPPSMEGVDEYGEPSVPVIIDAEPPPTMETNP